MNGAPRGLAIVALTLVLVGLVLGAWHGARVDHEALLALREVYAPAFEAQAHGDAARAQADLARAKAANLEHTRVIGAHTHLIKLATASIIVLLLWPVLGWDDGRKRLLAAALLTGTVLFPGGLLLQAVYPGDATRVVTALGAGLVLVSFAAFALGLLVAPLRNEP